MRQKADLSVLTWRLVNYRRRWVWYNLKPVQVCSRSVKSRHFSFFHFFNSQFSDFSLSRLGGTSTTHLKSINRHSLWISNISVSPRHLMFLLHQERSKKPGSHQRSTLCVLLVFQSQARMNSEQVADADKIEAKIHLSARKPPFTGCFSSSENVICI